MKSLSDYLHLVKTGIQNGDKIIEALAVSAQVKNGQINEEALAEILRRKDICKTCPFNSDNAKANGIEVRDLGFTHCIHCSCRIGKDDSKEYCLSCNCGIKVWNQQHPDQQMELKWTAFEVK